LVGNRVLLAEDEPEEMSAGGVIVVPFSDPLVFSATVVAVGSGKDRLGNRVPPDVDVGDKVYYTRYSRNTAVEVEVDDEKFVLLDADTLLAKEKA
jgi:co-chaperonin GroES (HSP10)